MFKGFIPLFVALLTVYDESDTARGHTFRKRVIINKTAARINTARINTARFLGGWIVSCKVLYYALND